MTLGKVVVRRLLQSWGPSLRAIAVVVMASVLAGCVWVMSRHVQGVGFLGPLEHATFESREVSCDDARTGDGKTAAAVSISQADVLAALGSLSFDGQDVSLASDGTYVHVDVNGIWVEQRSADDAATMVDKTARRATALATWARGRQASVPQLTFIVRDEADAVRMVESVSVRNVTKAHSTRELLASALGYQISWDAYASLDRPDFERESGVTPRLPTGSAVPISDAITEVGRGHLL